jgi:hypothetical protein
MDLDDNEMGARIVLGAKAAVTTKLADKMISELDTIGNTDLVDVLTFGAKTFGGPMTKAAVETAEQAVDALDTVIGAGLTVQETFEELKTWSSADSPDRLPVAPDAVLALADYSTTPGQNVKEVIVGAMKDMGKANRESVIQKIGDKAQSVAESVQRMRLETLQARQRTRQEYAQTLGAELTQRGEDVKQRAYSVLAAHLPASEVD